MRRIDMTAEPRGGAPQATSGGVEGSRAPAAMPASEGAARRMAPLAMDAASFRAAGHRLVDRIAELLESIPHRPVTRGETPAAVRSAPGLAGPPPEQGEEPAALLERTAGHRLVDRIAELLESIPHRPVT